MATMVTALAALGAVFPDANPALQGEKLSVSTTLSPPYITHHEFYHGLSIANITSSYSFVFMMNYSIDRK